MVNGNVKAKSAVLEESLKAKDAIFDGDVIIKGRQSKNERMDVLMITADDLGFSEIGCYGAQIVKTPNIDSIALFTVLSSFDFLALRSLLAFIS